MCMIYTRLLFFTLALILIACGRADQKAGREMELSYLKVLMGEELLPYAHLELAALENVTIEGTGADPSLGLHLFAGQKKRNGGVRAEVSVDFPHQQGDTLRYAWRFMLPEGSVMDGPKNRWCLFGQWHDQPDLKKHETWEGFPSHSPPVLLGLGSSDGGPAFSFEYGPKQAIRKGPFPIVTGVWHQVVMIIHWSQNDDGRATLFYDDLGKPLIAAEGANMHNDFQHYLKLGLYRHPDIQTNNSIFLDDLKITLEK